MHKKDIIIRNFSQCANHYDQYADIQNFCASRLIKKTNNANFLRILEIGCGTGNYTRLLAKRFPEAQIEAIDISRDMLLIAEKKLANRHIKFTSCDGEAIDLAGNFDLITSNSCLQWFEDLKKSLHTYRDMLIPRKGIILFSVFGPLTFWELNKSLKEAMGGDTKIAAANFIKKEDIKRALKKYFKEVNIEEKILKKRYPSFIELLKTIKYTGTRGDYIIKKIWTPNMISKIEHIYRERFSRADQKYISVTYQFFFCKAKNMERKRNLSNRGQARRFAKADQGPRLGKSEFLSLSISVPGRLGH
ncbi:MAG: malonyl-ACP O-methyltransferase BioC [Nitrospiraceae bacterium]|nr:malonyl-ACP O-methyltransferase BioC [Nitrospiraceae bacterium]